MIVNDNCLKQSPRILAVSGFDLTKRLIRINEEVGYVFLDNDESRYQTTHSIALALEPEGFQTGGMEGFTRDLRMSASIEKSYLYVIPSMFK